MPLSAYSWLCCVKGLARVLLVSLLVAVGAQAQESFKLSPVVDDEGSACVYQQAIYARAIEFKTGKEQKLCSGPPGDDAKQRRICLAQAMQKAINFFDDKCNEGFFFGLNGREHSLTKFQPSVGRFLESGEWIEEERKANSGNSLALLGRFRGDGFEVRVRHARLINRELDAAAMPSDDPILNETYRVWVDIRKGKQKKVFPAILHVNHR